ncbi:MAG: LCP family protein [Parasporobacterium sp.]|nr:LCP family protein [Parasporobacterium sp.]
MKQSVIRKIIVLTLTLTLLLAMAVSAEEPAVKQNLPDQINVVLFGLSGDNDGLDTNRTDSIIVITVDNAHKQLKFTSVLRDIKAAIEGHEPQKINAAYRYGGPDLALQTLNQNFGLNLKDYITVNFDQFAQIVWLLGGTEVELTAAEAEYLNEDSLIPAEDFEAGPRHLDGYETLEYCRIRKIDSDVQRSARQRGVLAYLLNKVTEMSLTEFSQMMTSFLSIVEATSLTPGSILTLCSIPYSEYEVINNHFPDADLDYGVSGGIDEHGEWVWFMDLNQAAVRFQDIIANEQPVQEPQE